MNQKDPFQELGFTLSNLSLYINRMMIPDIFGNQISGLDHGIPSKEKSVNGYRSFVGKYSFEWNGKSNKI